ncbi:hypothetical protein ACOACQ_07790 [Nocardioides sp. CPCC 206347]|uniref:hypothetical protein n=1 Tax=unclassified Nocardioides TaxID=2615069 RepID=UPI00360CB978
MEVMRMRGRRRAPAVILAIGLATGLTACGDGDDQGAGPSDPPATSPSTVDSSETSPSSPTTDVAPPGPLVKDKHVSFRLPGDLEWYFDGKLVASAYDADLNPYDVEATVVPLQAGDDVKDLDSDYAASVRTLGVDAPLKRGENRALDGVEGWTAETIDNGQLVVVFGTRHNGVSFHVLFSFFGKGPSSRAWIEATLASLQWK